MPEIRQYVQFDTLEATDALVVDRLGVGTGYVETSLVTSLTPTGVIAGSYTLTDLTVNEYGQITTASNGTAPGTGTVTSVALSLPAFITVSGSPVTTSGTLTGTLATQLANLVFAGPTTGAASAPTFRALVTADLPDTAVTPGSYTNTNLTVDSKGRITAAANGSTSAGDADVDLMLFGDGVDGDLAISSGTTTITRDMWYRNLTISGTGSLQTATGGGARAFQIHVSGILDITAAPAGGVTSFLASGTNSGSTGSPGNTVSPQSVGTVGAGSVGASGSAGGTGAGTVGTGSGTITAIGAAGGASGASGAGSNGSGQPSVAAGSKTAPTSDVRTLQLSTALWNSATYSIPAVGQGGAGGASGGGDGVHDGGGGGAGGSSPGGLDIFARTIARGGGTAAGAIANKGGNGGASVVIVSGTNTGGGGGGGGAGGGWIRLIYRFLTGTTATNCLDATGGSGGAGGDATGTGIGGDSGQPGGGGRIDVYDLGAGTQTMTAVVAPGSANAHSAGTGGATATPTAQRVSL